MARKIPPEEVCYICGKKADRRERNVKGIDTGKYICIEHYRIKYTYGTYEKPEHKYKISVSIDEDNYFWSIVDNGKLVKNPTDQELMGARFKSYNKTNICPICRKENNITDDSILYPHNACREYKSGKENGEWVCGNHRRRDYQRYDPNSRNNIIKSLRDRRIGNLDPNSIHAFSDNCEELTCVWKGVKNLNKELDCYNTPIDHTRDPELGIIQTKGRRYNPQYEMWNTDIGREHNKKFDVVIFYCISEDGKTVERVYIFPLDEIIKRKYITIYRYPSKNSETLYWYKKYRIIGEDTIKKVNQIWKQILKDAEEGECPTTRRK